jgi:4-hydroxy-tetrahydrodipicolinate synthase
MTPQELKKRIKGLVHLVMTHFDEEGKVDEHALRISVRHVANALKEVDAVFLATGSTAEFYAMTEEENNRVIRIVVEEVNGRFPVIAGTGRAGTTLTIEASQQAQELGADGVMIVPPYYNPVTMDGLYRHFTRVAENIDLGIMVYNNPMASRLWIPPDLMARLSKIEKIVADKENTANAIKYYFMQRAVDPEDMVIICGIGQAMYPFEAVFRCPGFVTEFANFAPEIAIDLYRAAQQRDFDRLTHLMDSMAPYFQFLAQLAQRRSPVPTILSPYLSSRELPLYQSVIKTAMEFVGLPGGRVREPMENLTEQEKEELREVLKGMGALS